MPKSRNRSQPRPHVSSSSNSLSDHFVSLIVIGSFLQLRKVPSQFVPPFAPRSLRRYNFPDDARIPCRRPHQSQRSFSHCPKTVRPWRGCEPAPRRVRRQFPSPRLRFARLYPQDHASLSGRLVCRYAVPSVNASSLACSSTYSSPCGSDATRSTVLPR